MKSLAVHSHKGGVGKSTLAVNIATELAKNHNVLILDLDLAGPSLQTFFESGNEKYLNEFLSQNCDLKDCINQYVDDMIGGNLYYALSDPSAKAIEKMLRIDKKSATVMLRQLLNMKKLLLKEYEIDYWIVDTSPGVNIVAGNAFVATDNILFVNKLSNADIEGSATMIEGILEYMDNKAFMVLNQIPAEKVDSEKERNNLMQLVGNTLDQKIGRDVITLVGILPMDFNLQISEFENAQRTMQGEDVFTSGRSGRHIYAIDEPDSIFSKRLTSIVESIF